MENITDDMQAFALSGPPSSLSSSKSNILANISSPASSRRPSSATSISPVASEAAMPSRKPSLVDVGPTAPVSTPPTPGKQQPTTSTSEESIHDDITQGRTRAMRRQALARKISAQLRTLPASTSSSSSSAATSSSSSRKPSISDDDAAAADARRTYIDTLAAREPEVYTPALAAYFGDHPDAIPAREEDAATRRRKRYDEHEVVTDRYGRTTRVDMRQKRLFQGWEWDASSDPRSASAGSGSSAGSGTGVSARESDTGPMGERERGEEVRCAHCERVGKREEMRRVAIKGFNKLLGRKGKGKGDDGEEKVSTAAVGEEKRVRKAVVEAEAAHAEQVERVDVRGTMAAVKVR